METSFKNTHFNSLVYAHTSVHRLILEAEKQNTNDFVLKLIDTLLSQLESFCISANSQIDKPYLKMEIEKIKVNHSPIYTGLFDTEHLERVYYGISDALKIQNEFVAFANNFSNNGLEKMDKEKYSVSECLNKAFYFSWYSLQIIKINLTPQLTFNF